MKKTKLNLRLLRKVRNRIAKIPESYNQGTFYQKDEDAPCGTAACLAGETVLVSRPTLKQGIDALRRMDSRYYREGVSTHPAWDAGRRLLGLTSEEADKMFDGCACGWPEPYRSQFKSVREQSAQAKIAVAYLDECLRRKAVTW